MATQTIAAPIRLPIFGPTVDQTTLERGDAAISSHIRLPIFGDTAPIATIERGGWTATDPILATAKVEAPLIIQRIYDTGLGQYVTYTKTEIDTAPLPGETVPNHTSNLVVDSHEIL